MRGVLRRLGLAAALCALIGLPAVPASAETGDAAAAQPSAGTVAVPYLGTTTIDVATPWRIADCAAVGGATPLVTGCDEASITLTAPEYDPEAAPVVLPVAVTDGRITTTVEYRVVLEAPETPAVQPSLDVRPTPAGALLRLPVSELGIECAVCGDRARLQAVSVRPRSAGSLWATPTHLVFRAADGFSGPVELGYRVADDFGTASPEASIAVSVYRPGPDRLATLDLVVELDGTDAELDAAELGFATGDDELLVVGCGEPIRGQVQCDDDGTVRFHGDGGADQFGIQLATSGGEHGYASVTLVPADAAAPAPGTAPIAKPKQGDDGVVLQLRPRQPVEDAGGSDGILTPLLSVLDRVGAR